MVTAVFVGIMLMALMAALSPSSLLPPLAAIVTLIVVLGSAFIDTGIGTGGWLLATIPLAPFIFAASYLVVWAIQLLGDGLGQTNTVPPMN